MIVFAFLCTVMLRTARTDGENRTHTQNLALTSILGDQGGFNRQIGSANLYHRFSMLIYKYSDDV